TRHSTRPWDESRGRGPPRRNFREGAAGHGRLAWHTRTRRTRDAKGATHMITGLGISTVWVLDQDEAKKFFTEKLGLEARYDMTFGEGGMRWVTVSAKNQPELQLTLMVPGPPT